MSYKPTKTTRNRALNPEQEQKSSPKSTNRNPNPNRKLTPELSTSSLDVSPSFQLGISSSSAATQSEHGGGAERRSRAAAQGGGAGRGEKKMSVCAGKREMGWLNWLPTGRLCHVGRLTQVGPAATALTAVSSTSAAKLVKRV